MAHFVAVRLFLFPLNLPPFSRKKLPDDFFFNTSEMEEEANKQEANNVQYVSNTDHLINLM